RGRQLVGTCWSDWQLVGIFVCDIPPRQSRKSTESAISAAVKMSDV
uniref:Uncharacterized protein n=1 Tax=Plectus sambesii TaxID=2011161 RepID=A0A914VCV9_9BILA